MDIKDLFGKVTIKGKEYEFPKPKVLFWVELEDSCFDSNTNTFDELAYRAKLIELVTKDVTIEDLVEYNEVTLVLENGATIKTNKLEYRNFFVALTAVAKKLNRIKTVSTFLEICNSEIPLDSLTYNDINTISNNLKSVFNTDELAEVILQIESFR